VVAERDKREERWEEQGNREEKREEKGNGKRKNHCFCPKRQPTCG
jgi:hypothetical protein